MSETAIIYSSKKEPLFLYFLIFLLFITSMGLWIGWNGRSRFVFAIIGLIMVAYMFIMQIPIDKSRKNRFSLLVLLIGFTYLNQISLSLVLSRYIPYALIICLNEKDRCRCIHYITKWYAFLMIPCIITYILFHTIGLPSIGTLVVNTTTWQPDLYLYRENLFFYNYTDYYDIRFNGPFIEPGHLGMMSSFLLFADGFNMKKKETWIILTSVLLSLSLSGYVLTFLAFCFTMYDEGKISLKFILFSFVLILAIYLFFSFYNGGDNLINEKIISRLEPDEERGFSGNNRVFGEIDIYFASMFTERSLLLYGYDESTMEYLAMNGSRGTGIIMYIVRNGILGTCSAIMFYVVYFIFCENKRYALLSLIFVSFMFWQRSYPFWFSWIICYVYGISVNKEINLDYENRNINISS